MIVKFLHILIIFNIIFFVKAYYPKALIPKRLRLKFCEQNPKLYFCDLILDSTKSKLLSNNLPADWSSKWEICDIRPDLLICRLMPYRDYAKSIKLSTMKPIPIYESSKENNGFEEPTTSTTKSVIIKFTNGIPLTTSTMISTTNLIEKKISPTSNRPIRQNEKIEQEKLVPFWNGIENISSSTMSTLESSIKTTAEPEGDIGSHHIKKQLTDNPTMTPAIISSTLSPSKELLETNL